MLFDYCHKFHQNPVPLTAQTFAQLLDAPWLHTLCEQIAAGDKDKKKELPAVTWQATFEGKKRANVNAKSSGLYELDVDHCNPDEVWSRISSRVEELGIYAAHKTASREGIRIVAKCRPEFSTLIDNQLWLSAQIGVQPDTACKDFARLGFICERSYFYYFNPNIFTDNADILLQNSSVEGFSQPLHQHQPSNVVLEQNVTEKEKFSIPQSAGKSNQEEKFSNSLILDKNSSIPDSGLEYRGIPYSEIVQELISRTGGEPYEGERNNRLYLICRLLANITDRQVDRLFRICPRFGLTDQEVRACCESACKSARTEKLPYVLYKVLRDFGIDPNNPASTRSNDNDDDDDNPGGGNGGGTQGTGSQDSGNSGSQNSGTPETPNSTKYTITVSSNDTNMGTVTGSGEYAKDSQATLKATPKSGYLFDQWSDGNQNATRTITVTRNQTLVATFYQEGTTRPSEEEDTLPPAE